MKTESPNFILVGSKGNILDFYQTTGHSKAVVLITFILCIT